MVKNAKQNKTKNRFLEPPTALPSTNDGAHGDAPSSDDGDGSSKGGTDSADGDEVQQSQGVSQMDYSMLCHNHVVVGTRGVRVGGGGGGCTSTIFAGLPPPQASFSQR